MNVQPEGGRVLLRNVSLQAESVRVGRADRPSAASPAPRVPSLSDATASQPNRDALRDEALQHAREEGLRLGRQEGLEAGLAEGRRKGEAEAQAAARIALEKAVAAATAPLQERERAFAALLASLGGQQAAWRELAEDEAVALAYELLCRVVGDALVTPQAVRAQARLLVEAGPPRELVIHVHPADADALARSDAASGDVRWVADPKVSLGGCVVQGDAGALDLRLETILERCRQGLLEVRATRMAGAEGGGS